MNAHIPGTLRCFDVIDLVSGTVSVLRPEIRYVIRHFVSVDVDIHRAVIRDLDITFAVQPAVQIQGAELALPNCVQRRVRILGKAAACLVLG